MSKTNQVTTQFQQIRVSVDATTAYREALKKLESENPRLYDENPGFMAVANAVGYTSTAAGKAAKKLENEQPETWKRVAACSKYMDDVGVGLSPSGKAQGILINAALVQYTPEGRKLERIQHDIWGKDETERLITARGLVQFFQAAAQTEFDVPEELKRYGNAQSAAEIIRETATNAGTPDTNAISVVCKMSEASTLTTESMEQTFRALGHEQGDPDELPREAHDAFAPFGQQVVSGQNGRQQAQPS